MGERESDLAGGATLANLRSGITYSQEAANDINTIYQQVLGRPVDSPSLPSIENDLAGSQTLAGERSSVAYSAEAAAIVTDVYAEWGQGTPTAQQINDGQAALYGLSLGYAIESGWSQDQLTAAASGYNTPAGDHWIQEDLANLRDQNQAFALVASALTNSYIDGADDTASVLGVLQQGGIAA
ncbi:MAG: hypothetical protein ACRYFY_06785 [Janthinobacterium lividum]